MSSKLTEDILPLLKKLKDDGYIILMPQQVIDEINRNRFTKWAEGNYDSRKKELQKVSDLLQGPILVNLSGIRQLTSSIKKEQTRLLKEDEKLFKHLTSPTGRSFKLIKELIALAEIVPDSSEITEATYRRVIKGNPPFDKTSDGKNADRYIWESILEYFRAKSYIRPELYLFSKNTEDWCVQRGDKKQVHPFLKIEFEELTKGGLIWSDDLQNLPNITPAEKKTVQDEEKKLTESDKLVIVEKRLALRLRESNSWQATDKLLKLSTPFISKFGVKTIVDVIHAARDNVLISFGPYNQVLSASEALDFFAKLYKRSLEIGVPLNEWKQLYLEMDSGEQERYINLRKSLENKGIKFSLDELKYYLPEDLPF